MLHRHGAPDPATDASLPRIALVGRPNVGKSTFLARASRAYVEASNAPGTTVRLEQRRVDTGGDAALLVDLPGTRSLDDVPAGDEPFWQTLLDARPDAILVIVDAGDLTRHLPLALACRDLGLPVVVAANLVDEARGAGIDVDAGRLGQLLALPVVATCARTGEGVDGALRGAVARARQRAAVREGMRSPRGTIPAPVYPADVEARLAAAGAALAQGPRSLGAAAASDVLAAAVAAGSISPRGAATIQLGRDLAPRRAEVAERWADEVEHRRDVPEPLADRIARRVTAPWPGLPLFVLATVGSFAAVVMVGGLLSSVLTSVWMATVSPALTAIVSAVVPVPTVANALLWAVDGGLLAMLAVGIPYVLTFYLVLAALEDTGYLTSAAVLMDRLFGFLGLPGRAAIPLLTATGCNVPAVHGTRILRTQRERVIAGWLVTLMPCSARSAILIAAVAPFLGFGAAMAAFVIIGGLAILTGIGANAMIPGRQPALVLELSPLRLPIAGHVWAKAWHRFRAFVVTATPYMLVGSFIVGLAYESGAWQPVAEALDPVTMSWMGLPAVAVVAIVFAFLRKELALQLLLVFGAVELAGAAAGGAGSSASDLTAVLGPAQLFVFAIVASISIPCVATLATLRAELGGRAATAIALGSMLLAVTVGIGLAHALGIA
ncbi:MAG: ferrous iron transporter B [Chloroflexi bacterium]|jgi:ferrous iron transport protein B|nr:ferrous iron transporter B [Chloroflexota bacterium]